MSRPNVLRNAMFSYDLCVCVGGCVRACVCIEIPNISVTGDVRNGVSIVLDND
eukprot:GAHX01004458.1.p1 GENE.GAHX01004458.1~~GAHX01004458.1.p1  ORF type:complete len:53 (+),score=2.04 GAHX01004458.1:562-720(+)